MGGYAVPWFLATSALALTVAQVAEAWVAQCRQEDGFRDHKQRLGMEECRAWTKEPILRTFQTQLVALTLLRLLQARLNHTWGHGNWWLTPEWNPRKRHASILDLRRLCWRYRPECAPFWLALEKLKNIPTTSSPRHSPAGRAA